MLLLQKFVVVSQTNYRFTVIESQTNKVFLITLFTSSILLKFGQFLSNQVILKAIVMPKLCSMQS